MKTRLRLGATIAGGKTRSFSLELSASQAIFAINAGHQGFQQTRIRRLRKLD